MSVCEEGFSGRTVILSMVVSSVAGAVAGAALVLLVAPDARRESAERIREMSRDLTERATSSVDTAKENVSSAVSRGREFIADKRSVLSSAVDAGKRAFARTRAEAAG